MHKLYQAAVLLLSLTGFVSFIGSFITNMELFPYLDPERKRKKIGDNRFWYSRVYPIEFYDEKGWPIWKKRDRFTKAFVVSVVFLVFTILIGVIGGMSL